MPTLYIPAERTPYFIDNEGYPSAYKDEDSVESHMMDWSRFLGTDTISSSSWATTGGVATSGASNTTTTTTVTVTGTDGAAVNTVITAAGRTYIRTIRFYGRQT